VGRQAFRERQLALRLLPVEQLLPGRLDFGVARVAVLAAQVRELALGVAEDDPLV
jgi:hypothetical protein